MTPWTCLDDRLTMLPCCVLAASSLRRNWSQVRAPFRLYGYGTIIRVDLLGQLLPLHYILSTRYTVDLDNTPASCRLLARCGHHCTGWTAPVPIKSISRVLVCIRQRPVPRGTILMNNENGNGNNKCPHMHTLHTLGTCPLQLATSPAPNTSATKPRTAAVTNYSSMPGRCRLYCFRDDGGHATYSGHQVSTPLIPAQAMPP